MTRRPRIAIIGGGIGGLTAANALARMGLDADVYEQADGLGEVGAGLQLGPNGVRVLYALGFKPDLDRLACAPPDQVSIDWRTAAVRLRQPLSSEAVRRFGAPYLQAHRHDVYDCLVRTLPPARVHLGMSCTGVSSDSRTAVATFANGRQVEADVIIGADGVRSMVRECLFGKDRPRYTGQSCFRTMLQMDEVPDAVGPDKVSLKVVRSAMISASIMMFRPFSDARCSAGRAI